MAESLDTALTDVLDWAFSPTSPFLGQQAQHAANHCYREAKEWKDAPNDLEEMADIVMIVAHGAALAGYSLPDLAAEVQRKLAVCKAREWSTPDADGVVEHVRATPPASEARP